MNNEDLKILADKQNAAMNRIRANGGGYQAFITAAHIIGPFGGGVALELQIGFETVRKQLDDFISEVVDWENTAAMAENRTAIQKMWAWMSGVRPLKTYDVQVVIY